MREIWLHVEGGGNSFQKERFRQALSYFLTELQEKARRRDFRIRITFWGSRSATYDSFSRAMWQNPGTLHLLLVDSEGPVDETPRRHLSASDKWYLSEVHENQCHLMVQAMEVWLIADPEALAAFYGQGFAANALPRTKNVEQIPKDRLASSLTNATRTTQKGEYHKSRHAPQILERLDPDKVRSRAPHCERLFTIINEQLSKG